MPQTHSIIVLLVIFKIFTLHDYFHKFFFYQNFKVSNFVNQFSRSKKISTLSYVIERFYGGVVWGTQGKQRGQSHLK